MMRMMMCDTLCSWFVTIMRWCPSLLALSLSHLYTPQYLTAPPTLTLCCPFSGPFLPHWHFPSFVPEAASWASRSFVKLGPEPGDFLPRFDEGARSRERVRAREKIWLPESAAASARPDFS